ncbi:MarR family winged helix-turn-helix transcriptional regulator [Methylobacterium dankookense]|uniref:Transcriptional activatory protein BadR n=1 Tax=Methylobacterium dankookense TaxID=560405 RepID=A0A564G8G6_9HYPH|nr:MarR family transcriptional regulator [Methylobacterium dankookense]GJD59863.1 Transcriptional activatory protein BadR [Methylobacterium dankookense]VUF16100.1 Transcriptional activatory protein BadR [Methylobacterium dankookense]
MAQSAALLAQSETEGPDALSRDDPKLGLRAWLRLFGCSTLIENEIRKRLREEFDFTLPRFDLLAQLDKAEDGLVLGEASRRLMVSAGNITAITEGLLKTGYIVRDPDPNDKRVQRIRMTHAGRAAFKVMASAHADWINELFSALSAEEITALDRTLTKLKHGLQARLEK